MKVCHVIGTLDPAKGGPPVVVLELAVALQEAGARVRVVAPEEPQRREAVETLLERVAGARELEIHRLPVRGRLDRWSGSSASSGIRPLLADVDVVHLHGVWEPLLLRVAAVARRRGTPYVISPHGMLYPYCLGQKQWKKRAALAVAHRRFLDRAATLHALNADERESFTALGLEAPITVAPNGVDWQRFPKPSPGRFRAAHPELGDQPYFVFVGRLHAIKGIDLLIEAFRLATERGLAAHLVIVGPDAGEEQHLRDQVRIAGLTQQVHFTGPLYSAEKDEALHDALAYAHAGRHETFSMAITEALGHGRPVVITENCHFPEVKTHGAGIVTPLDPGVFARGLSKLGTDPEGAAEMGAAGRRLVQERFTWPHVADTLMQRYSQLGRQARPRHAPGSPLELAKPVLRAVKYHHLRRQAERSAHRAGPGDTVDVPAPMAFIVACGRSGTTLLGHLFEDHPAVTYWFEPYHLWAAVDRRTDASNLYHSIEGRAVMDSDLWSPTASQRFARLFLRRHVLEGTRCVVEKTPINSLRLGYLDALAPGARYVHIVRDGVDVVHSIERLATGNTYRIAGKPHMNQWWGVDDAKWRALARDGAAAEYFRAELETLVSHEQRAAYEWVVSLLEVDRHREVLGDRLLEFTYEDLTRAPRETLTRVCTFLDLEVPTAWFDRAIATVDRTRRNEPSPVTLPPEMGRVFRELQRRHGFRGRVRDAEEPG